MTKLDALIELADQVGPGDQVRPRAEKNGGNQWYMETNQLLR
jgi:hypothetical protein